MVGEGEPKSAQVRLARESRPPKPGAYLQGNELDLGAALWVLERHPVPPRRRDSGAENKKWASGGQGRKASPWLYPLTLCGGGGVLPASVRALGPGCDAQQAGGLT